MKVNWRQVEYNCRWILVAFVIILGLYTIELIFIMLKLINEG